MPVAVITSDEDLQEFKQALRCFFATFRRADPVHLQIAAHKPDEAKRALEEVLAEGQWNQGEVPEIRFLPGGIGPQEVGARVVIGPRAFVASARRQGVPAYDFPDPAVLRVAIDTFDGLEWESRLVPQEIASQQSFLVAHPGIVGSETDVFHVTMEGCLQALDGFLKQRELNACLVLWVGDIPLERVEDVLLRWFEIRGLDPGSIPDVYVLGTQDGSISSVFQAASAWLDTGDLLGRAIALGFGKDIVPLSRWFQTPQPQG